MSISSNSFTAGYGGHKVYPATANTGLKLRGIIPHADCTPTVAEDKDGNDILAALGWSNGLIKGVFYPIEDGNYFSALTIGAVFVGYKAEGTL